MRTAAAAMPPATTSNACASPSRRLNDTGSRKVPIASNGSVLFRPVERQRQGGESADGDKDHAEQQRDGEHAAFVVDHVARDAGTRDVDRHDGGSHDGGQRKPDDGDQFSQRDAAPLVTERAAGGGRETGFFKGVAHNGPKRICSSNGSTMAREPGGHSARFRQSRLLNTAFSWRTAHDPEKWAPVSRLREARFGGRRKVG